MARPRAVLLGSVQCRKEASSWQNASYGPTVPPPPDAGAGDRRHRPDFRFLDGMIAHHQGAIDEVRAIEPKVRRPEVKQLAPEIIKAQEAEIRQMREWRRAWFAVSWGQQALSREQGRAQEDRSTQCSRVGRGRYRNMHARAYRAFLRWRARALRSDAFALHRKRSLPPRRRSPRDV